jgi:hypothetical protein
MSDSRSHVNRTQLHDRAPDVSPLPKLINGYCPLIGVLLLFNLFGKISLEKFGHRWIQVGCDKSVLPSRDSVIRTAVGLHDNILPAQCTTRLSFSLHDNEASYAEQMAAPQPHRAICDGEADGAQIVVELRHQGENLVGDLGRKDL